MSFRVAELQMLLGFAGKQKSGKKNELQVQALELLKGRALTTSVQNKIKELHRQRYNNLGFVSSAIGNSSDSCDSDMASNYGQTSASMTTRSASHGLHLSSQQTNSNHMLSTSSVSALNNSSIANNNMKHNSHQSSQSRSDYYGSMPRGLGLDYAPKSYQSMPSSVPLPYPVYPDVTFKGLPFYDILGDLLKPSSLSMTYFLINYY
jgi:hypothetical protein